MAREINAVRFARHLNVIVKMFQTKSKVWNDADAVCFPVGKFESGWFKSTAIHNYLFSLEFTDTVLCLTESTLHILASKSKATKYFEPAVQKITANGFKPAPTCKIELHVLSKKEEAANDEIFRKVVAAIKSSKEGKKVAMVTKEQSYLNTGKVYPAWMKVFEASGFEIVSAVPGIASVFSVKDETEIENLKSAGSIASKLLRYGLKDKLENVIDQDLKEPHSRIAEEVDALLDQPKKIRAKYVPDQGDVETCMLPVIQSGGKYNLKLSAISGDETLKFDVILAEVSCRYKLYCARICRTYFVDASKAQKTAYACLSKAYEDCIRAIKPGVLFKDVHEAARVSLEKSKMPELAACMRASIGSGIGIEMKESMNLTAKSSNVIRAGMAFYVRLAVENVQHETSAKEGAGSLEKYPMQLGDTIVVLSDIDERTGNHVVVATKCKHVWTKVAWYINAEDDDDEEEEEEEEAEGKGLSKEDRAMMREAKAFAGNTDASGRATRSSRRRESTRDRPESNIQAELRRAERQLELMHERAKQHQGRAAAAANGRDEGATKTIDTESIETMAYASGAKFPKEARNSSVYVDDRAEVVFLPINGIAVPFHISTIKSVSKSDGHRATYLRINFNTPAKTTASRERNRHTLANLVHGKYPKAVFLKDISVRSSNAANLNKQLRLIKELQKRIRTREREKKELEDVIEQAPIKLIRNPPKLQDLSMKPNLSGRATHGTLEAHENGFRFRSVKGEKLEINYVNIQHAVFQPCIQELTVIIHIHLVHPIIINKKKTVDVQFYTEVVESGIALKKSRRSMYDPDEVDEEQRERKLKRKLNQLFKKFQQRVNNLLEQKLGKDPIDFDVPYRELGFNGAPQKEMVKIYPCTRCLVSLTEYPFFVVSLDDIDHVHMERASISSRTTTFEMVLILKDRKKEPIRIDMIPSQKLDDIEEWLDSIKQSYTKGAQNWNWKSIMKMVIDNELDGFFWSDTDPDGQKKPVGWLFLSDQHKVEEDGEGSDGGEESGSDFAPPSDEDEDEEDDWDPSDDDEEDESDYDDEDDEDSADDWENMERQAKADDAISARKRERDAERDRHRAAKKKKRR